MNIQRFRHHYQETGGILNPNIVFIEVIVKHEWVRRFWNWLRESLRRALSPEEVLSPILD